jgi:hypothetical protein
MNAGLRRGLGDGPLAERVFTHTFMATVNGLFEDYLQATAIGVIRNGRLGGEWIADISLFPVIEQHRELGVPAAINRECGGGQSARFDNRSYRADRLRCESSIVGWRADAYWALARAREDAAKWPVGDPDRARLNAAQELFAAGSYRRAYQAVRAIVDRRASPPAVKPWAPAADRQDRGELVRLVGFLP